MSYLFTFPQRVRSTLTVLHESHFDCSEMESQCGFHSFAFHPWLKILFNEPITLLLLLLRTVHFVCLLIEYRTQFGRCLLLLCIIRIPTSHQRKGKDFSLPCRLSLSFIVFFAAWKLLNSCNIIFQGLLLLLELLESFFLFLTYVYILTAFFHEPYSFESYTKFKMWVLTSQWWAVSPLYPTLLEEA